jgi:putative spermidine/putrescine transport system permease protein
MSEFVQRPARITSSGAWFVICFLVLPILVVFPVSLTDRSYLSLPENGLSLQYFINFFTSRAWLSSFGQSFVIATGAAAIATTAGTLCAIGCWRLGSRASEFLRLAMLLPMMVPTIVYVLGLYRLWSDLRLLSTYTGVIIAHAVTGIPYVVIIVSAGLSNFDLRLEQAARGLGATISQSLRLVLLPNIMPAVASGAIFAFIHSWDELLIVLFIAGRAILTLPRRIWDGIQEALDPTMAAVAVLLVLLTIILLGLDLTLRKRQI